MRAWVGSAFMLLILLASCSNKIDFVEEKPFVQLELYSASEGTYLDHFPKIITVSNNGSVHLFTKETTDIHGKVDMKAGEDAPSIRKEISTEEVDKIKQSIENNRFFSLPEDVTDYDVMDGDGSSITVYEKENKKQSAEKILITNNIMKLKRLYSNTSKRITRIG